MGAKVYGPRRSTLTARAIVALEVMGVDYEVVPFDFFGGEHKQPAHLTRNLFGRVPVLEDGDVTLFESRAIARYLARKYKSSGPDLLREGDLQVSAMVDQWMEIEAHEYNPAMSPIVFQLFVIPMRGGVPDQQVINDSLVELEQVLDIYEDRLSKSKYLAGDFFSLDDLNHLPLTYYFMTTPYSLLFKLCPHLNAWWEDWSSRPAVKKATDAMVKSR